MRKFVFVPLAAVALASACSETPTSLGDSPLPQFHHFTAPSNVNVAVQGTSVNVTWTNNDTRGLENAVAFYACGSSDANTCSATPSFITENLGNDVSYTRENTAAGWYRVRITSHLDNPDGTHSSNPGGSWSPYSAPFEVEAAAPELIPQAIDFTNPGNKTYGDASFQLVATGGASGNPVTFALSVNSAGCSLSGTHNATVTITGATGPGQACRITASQAGGNGYADAEEVEQTFTIAKAPLTISVVDGDDELYDRAIYFGQSVPASFVAANGFVYSESWSAIGGQPTASWTGAATFPQVGNYVRAIDRTAVTTNNYDVTYEDGALTILAWTSRGYFSPVKSGWNTVKSGSTVPLKFQLFQGAEGENEVVSTAQIVFRVQAKPCQNGGAVDDDEITELSTGGTVLRYSGTPGVDGQFIQNWQTPSRKAGMCYAATMSVGGAVILSSDFQLK
jgi:hypothetical protein